MRFINHACLVISTEDIMFATDPWLFGPAFCNGWWLSKPSPKESLELINECTFIYISHNHSDHLHPETLSKIRTDMPILTANYLSGSTTRTLQKMGFEHIITNFLFWPRFIVGWTAFIGSGCFARIICIGYDPKKLPEWRANAVRKVTTWAAKIACWCACIFP